ncbi:hypothetical protein L486_03759 [Kwoniella mangroviensis CBS 10435]|uniref:Uncharacterized protein n=1 Tax=Kwoniella mangroviensis CBS 10435 TaxID=1331196 RepID=A0A1B9IUP6_9TREE|nr:hypothetical protein L486_03759 [Kwoniella mangroviensis CBS 10435]
MFYSISKKDGTFSYRILDDPIKGETRTKPNVSGKCARGFGNLVKSQIDSFNSCRGDDSGGGSTTGQEENTRGIFDRVISKYSCRLSNLCELHKTSNMNDRNSILDSRTTEHRIPNSVVILVTQDRDGEGNANGGTRSLPEFTSGQYRILGARLYIPPLGDEVRTQSGLEDRIYREQIKRGFDLAHEIYKTSNCLSKDPRIIYSIIDGLTNKQGRFSDCSVVWVNQSSLDEIGFLEEIDGIEDRSEC